MYSLVSRVPVGMTELRKKFESHVHSQGLSAIEKCGDTVVNVSCPSTCDVLSWYLFLKEPKLYVHTLLGEYNKYHLLVTTSFNDDAGFLQALDKVPTINCDSEGVN